MDIPVKLQVSLTPVGEPHVQVTAPGFDQHLQLLQPTVLDINFITNQDQATLTVQHLHKANHDATTAVIIHSVSFYGIQDPRFAWAGVYHPDYPEPWASEQKANGVQLEEQVPGELYLGHNGVWRFNFTSPVYKFLVDWARG